MEQAGVIVYWLSFCGLVMAAVVYAFEISRHHSASVLSARVLSALSWILLTVSVYMSSRVHHQTPLTGSNQLVLLAWALILVYFLFEYLLDFSRYGAALIPVAAILLFVAQVIAPGKGNIAPTPDTITAAMNSVQVGIHVLFIVFANALLLIGSVAAALYLYQDRALKRHSNAAFARALPPLANIERLIVRVTLVALPVYFAGQMLGVARAIVVDAQGWYFDVRILLSFAILFVFGHALFLYYRQKTATIAIVRNALIGGALITALMIVARTLPVGFHVFGVL